MMPSRLLVAIVAGGLAVAGCSSTAPRTTSAPTTAEASTFRSSGAPPSVLWGTSARAYCASARLARAVVIDAIDERAAHFYKHFDFHNLDQGRLWRRLSDIATALGASG